MVAENNQIEVFGYLDMQGNFTKVKESSMDEKAQCPNCHAEAIKEGNKITCQHCDSVFTITKTGSATVAAIGRLDSLENRLAKVEAQISTEPEPAPAPAPDSDDDNDDDDEPESMLPK